MRNGRMSVIGALVVASALLTACQGATSPGESSAPPPSSSAPPSSPTPSASPSPTPKHADENGPGENLPVPKLPDAAKEHTEKGAAAFVEFYFDLANYSIEMQDTTKLEKYTSKNCILCGEGIIDQIWYKQDTKQWEVGGLYAWEVLESEIIEDDLGRVFLSLGTDASKLYSKTQGLVDTREAAELTPAVMTLKFDTRWQVESIVIEG